MLSRRLRFQNTRGRLQARNTLQASAKNLAVLIWPDRDRGRQGPYRAMKAPRIVILVPYFGRWPFWIDFFWESMRWNQAIDWRFYTDCGVPANAPDNASFFECSYQSYQDRVSSALGLAFNPAGPYKLCDIKPAYGYIHAGEITDYDFWGFGDIDVVWGDIMGFITQDMLRHQLISFHKRRVSGHLCLLANTPFAREAFMQQADWRDTFQRPEHTAFDEKDFGELFMRHKDWPRWLRRMVYFNNPYMRSACFNEAYSTSLGRVPWVDGSFDFPRRWVWRQGKLSCDKPEQRVYPYLHFIEWKKLWAERDENELVQGDTSRIAEGFEITQDGFRVL